jgi:hypothetical protein
LNSSGVTTRVLFSTISRDLQDAATRTRSHNRSSDLAEGRIVMFSSQSCALGCDGVHTGVPAEVGGHGGGGGKHF